jgi:hypothetical protein
MLEGLVASRVLYRGERLLSFKLELGGFVVSFWPSWAAPHVDSQDGYGKPEGLADFWPNRAGRRRQF